MRASILESRRHPERGVAADVSHSIAFVFEKDGAQQNPEERFAELKAEYKGTPANWKLKGDDLISDFINTVVLDIGEDVPMDAGEDDAMEE